MRRGHVGLLLALAGPPTVWAVHFIAVYALISAACAPRELIGTGWMTAGTTVLTLVCVVAALVPILWTPRSGGPELAHATRWLAAISAAAVVFNALPFLFTTTCGG